MFILCPCFFPAGQSHVVVRGCSSILFNAFSIWWKTECRPMQLPVLEYTSDVFKEHICEDGQVGTNLLDPFTILDYLLLRLVGAVQQARLMAMPEFHGCLRQRQVPFASVCTVISELVHHWVDVKLLLIETGTVLPAKGKLLLTWVS